MKRLRMIICLAAAAAMLASVAAVSVNAEIKYVRGDADGDGVVNINDVTKIQRILANLETDTGGAVKRSCDFDGKGLDINDATKIQSYLAEFTNTYKIGTTFSYDEYDESEEYELPFIPSP